MSYPLRHFSLLIYVMVWELDQWVGHPTKTLKGFCPLQYIWPHLPILTSAHFPLLFIRRCKYPLYLVIVISWRIISELLKDPRKESPRQLIHPSLAPCVFINRSHQPIISSWRSLQPARGLLSKIFGEFLGIFWHLEVGDFPHFLIWCKPSPELITAVSFLFIFFNKLTNYLWKVGPVSYFTWDFADMKKGIAILWFEPSRGSPMPNFLSILNLDHWIFIYLLLYLWVVLEIWATFLYLDYLQYTRFMHLELTQHRIYCFL